MKPLHVFLAITLLTATALLIFRDHDEQDVSEPAASARVLENHPKHVSSRKTEASNTSTDDRISAAETEHAQLNQPWAPDAMEMPVPLSEADLAREKEMERLGYLVPPEYHEYELHYLKALAAQGDVYAKVHLAERYYFEIKTDPSHPYFDRKVDYLAAATNHLKDALANGHAHSAAMLAEIHLIENHPVEAAAWSLLSERVGDHMSRDWFKRTDIYNGLTPEQTKAAESMADNLAASLRQHALKQEKASLFDAAD